MSKRASTVQTWCVYVLQSRKDGRTYVGVSRNWQRRLRQHNGSLRGGAKATRRSRPWVVLHVVDGFSSRGEAQVAEARLKKLKAEQKISFSLAELKSLLTKN